MGRYEFDKVDSLTLADSIHQSLTSDELNSLIDDIILDDSELQACIDKTDAGIYIFGQSHVQWKYINKREYI